jgi:hypothetical protein
MSADPAETSGCEILASTYLFHQITTFECGDVLHYSSLAEE